MKRRRITYKILIDTTIAENELPNAEADLTIARINSTLFTYPDPSEEPAAELYGPVDFFDLHEDEDED